MSRTAELADVKVGDQLVASRRKERWLVTVTRVTKTRVVTDDGNSWMRSTGRRVGDGSDPWSWADV